MALTASAPPATIHDISLSLSLKSPVSVMHNLNHPNIFLSVGTRTSIVVSNVKYSSTHSFTFCLRGISMVWLHV